MISNPIQFTPRAGAPPTRPSTHNAALLDEIIDTYDAPLRPARVIRNGAQEISWPEYGLSWAEAVWEWLASGVKGLGSQIVRALRGLFNFCRSIGGGESSDQRAERIEGESVMLLAAIMRDGLDEDAIETRMDELHWTEQEKVQFMADLAALRRDWGANTEHQIRRRLRRARRP